MPLPQSANLPLEALGPGRDQITIPITQLLEVVMTLFMLRLRPLIGLLLDLSLVHFLFNIGFE